MVVGERKSIAIRRRNIYVCGKEHNMMGGSGKS